MQTKPFSGPQSLRVRGEWRRLVLTLLFLPVTLLVVGFFFHNTVTTQSILLIVVGAMLFIALNRGRFLGGGVRVGPAQFGELHALVEECAKMLGVPVPSVFVRDDPFVPIVGLGTGDPYAIVFSAQYIEAFTPDELRFLIGRELAHIAAGHTKLTSLLSTNGRENAVVSIAFGAWLRVIEYTADRAGLLCCGSLGAAFSAIAVSTFHHVGRKIDLHAFAEQRREIDADSALRMGEWLGATPYATNRIARLASFARDPLFVVWAPRFEERRAETADAQPLAPDDPRRFAGPWQRALAFCIDLFVVSALVPAAARLDERAPATRHAIVMTAAERQSVAAMDLPGPVKAIIEWFGSGHASLTNGDVMIWPVLALYVLLLVAFAGQTLGMMICDLRVVGVRRERVGLRGAVSRYVMLLLSLPLIVGVFALFRRVQPFERWSRTRLITGATGRS